METEPTPTQSATAWSDIAKGWHEWIPAMHDWYLPATERMLDLAEIGIGDRVLDIAAGDCDQAIDAARRVGPNGHVLAIDMAPDMLAIGARTARDLGLRQLETRVMDAQNLELPDASFAAAICRFGLMLLPDPIGALREIGRVLVSDARFSMVVYADEGDPEFVTAVSVVRRLMGLGPARSQATDLGTLEGVEKTLAKGGLRNIASQLLQLPVRMDSAHACVQYLQATSPTLASLISPLPADNQQEIWKVVEKELAKYEGNGRFEVEHRVIVAAGTAP